MNMAENYRLLLGLRERGWSDTDIVNFLMWVETGEEQYRQQDEEKK